MCPITLIYKMKSLCLEISTTDRSVLSTILKKFERIYKSFDVKIFEVEAAEKFDKSYFGVIAQLKISVYEMVIAFEDDQVRQRIIKVLKAHVDEISLKKKPFRPRDSWFDWDDSITHST